MPASDATDSASVPWSGRELSPSGFETDTGATDPALLAALTADDDTLMAAVVTGRFLVPIVAEPVEIDDSGPLAADTHVDMALVTPDGPGRSTRPAGLHRHALSRPGTRRPGRVR